MSLAIKTPARLRKTSLKGISTSGVSPNSMKEGQELFQMGTGKSSRSGLVHYKKQNGTLWMNRMHRVDAPVINEKLNVKKNIKVDGISQLNKVGIGIQKPLSTVHIVDRDRTAFSTRVKPKDFDIVLKNKTNEVDAFSGIAFDPAKGSINNGIGACIAGLSDNTATDLHDTNLVFATNDGNVDGLTERLRITNDGKVGIGNNTPGSMLEISKVTGSATLELSSWSDTATAAHAGALKFQKSGTAAINTFTAGDHTTVNEVLGRVEAWGVTDSDDATLSSYIEFANDATSDADSVPGRIIFATSDADDAGSPTERMRIDDDGGTKITGVCEVRGGTGTGFDGAGKLKLTTNEPSVVDGDVLGAISFIAPGEAGEGDSNLPAAAIWCEADAAFSSSANNGELVFSTAYTTTALATANERMRITSDGKVGIGTSTPEFKLEVVGSSNDVGRAIKIKGTGASGTLSGGVLRLECDDGAAMADTHRLGAVSFGGAEDSSSNMVAGARIECFADEAWSASENGTYMTFGLNYGDNTGVTERMRIDDAGNVGINNTVANQKLTIGGSMSFREQASANATTAGYGQLWVKDDTPTTLYFTDDAGNDKTYLPLTGGTMTGSIILPVQVGHPTGGGTEGEIVLSYTTGARAVERLNIYINGAWRFQQLT